MSGHFTVLEAASQTVPKACQKATTKTSAYSVEAVWTPVGDSASDAAGGLYSDMRGFDSAAGGMYSDVGALATDACSVSAHDSKTRSISCIQNASMSLIWRPRLSAKWARTASGPDPVFVTMRAVSIPRPAADSSQEISNRNDLNSSPRFSILIAWMLPRNSA